MSETFIYGIIWGILSFLLGMWIGSYDTTILNIISFIVYGFSGLCFLRAFRLF